VSFVLWFAIACAAAVYLVVLGIRVLRTLSSGTLARYHPSAVFVLALGIGGAVMLAVPVVWAITHVDDIRSTLDPGWDRRDRPQGRVWNEIDEGWVQMTAADGSVWDMKKGSYLGSTPPRQWYLWGVRADGSTLVDGTRLCPSDDSDGDGAAGCSSPSVEAWRFIEPHEHPSAGGAS
jgi:hypothetical protein